MAGALARCRVCASPRVNVLEVRHRDDLVPQLDLGGAAAGASLGPAGAVDGAVLGAAASDALTNHDYNNYRDSMADTGKYPDIASYENDPSMSPFITDDRSRVSAVDIPTGRNG
ncbi:hypothetical protein ACX80E_08530 [Arthrobacter sp. TMN-49]